MFISIIRWKRSLVSTSVRVIRFPSCTKPNPGVARIAVILVVSSYADSCFGKTRPTTDNIEPFCVMKYYLLSKGIPTTWSHLCLQRHRWGNYKINRFKRASSYGNLLGCIIYLLAWFYGWKIKRWSEKYIIPLGTEKKWKVWFLSKSLVVNVFELMLGFVFEMDF